MKLLAKLAFLFALVAGPAAAQSGYLYQNYAVNQVGNPVATAVVTVCAGDVLTGPVPCANPTTIYKNEGLSVVQANPFGTGPLGNYAFAAAPGVYTISLTGTGLTATNTVVTLPCVVGASNCGGSGGGIPGGLDTQVQVNQAGAFAGFTGFGLDSSTSPTYLNVPFSERVAGPDPVIDVTAFPYSAPDDGVTDATAAIQAAINAACVSGGSVFIPPPRGPWYAISQTQLPSLMPDLYIPCEYLHIIGGNAASNRHQGTDGAQAPLTTLVVINSLVGANPNNAPLIGMGVGENLTPISSISSNGTTATYICANTPCFPRSDITQVQIWGTTITSTCPGFTLVPFNTSQGVASFTINPGYSGNTFTAPFVSHCPQTATGGFAGIYSETGFQNGGYTNAGTTIENLTIQGWNQAVGVFAVNGHRFINDCLANNGNASARPDHTPWKETNSFEVYYYGGCLNASGANNPVALFTGEAPIAGDSPVFGIFIMRDTLLSGGTGIIYTQRSQPIGPSTGSWDLQDLVFENLNNSAAITFTNTSGFAMQLSGFTLQNVVDADNSGGNPQTKSIVYLNGQTNDYIAGISVRDSSTSGGYAITNAPGTEIRMFRTDSCLNSACLGSVLDSNGNKVGSGFVVGDTVDYTSISVDTFPLSNGVPGTEANESLRFFPDGTLTSTLGISPFDGVQFNVGANNGYSAAITQSAQESMDITFAKLLPPSNIVPTATTGGSIAAGTYYVWMDSTNNSCNTVPGQSAAAVSATSVVLSGANNAVNVSWTPPQLSALPQGGYCIVVSTSNTTIPVAGTVTHYYSIAGGSVTSTITPILTIAGANSMAASNTQVAVHRFTVDGLNLTGGVNTYPDTGTTNAYIITPSPAISVIPLQYWACFIPLNTNTGAATLKVGSAAAVALVKDGGTALIASDVVLGHNTCVSYNGTNFDVINPDTTSGGGGGLVNPMTLHGQFIFENATPAPAAGAANTSTTMAVMTETGSGSAGGDLVLTPSVGGGTSPVAATVTSPAQSQILFYNPSGVLINGYAGVAVDPQTGNYTLACPLDRLGEIEFNIPAAATLSVPQAGSTACFGSNISFVVRNTGSSTGVLSVTATTSTFQPEGLSTLTVLPGASLFVYSDATTSTGNYHAVPVPTLSGGVNEVLTGYNTTAGDTNKLVVANCTAFCNIVMPATPPNGNWNIKVLSIGSTLAAVALGGANFNGSPTAPTLVTGQALTIFTDGTNYFGSVPIGSASGVSSLTGDGIFFNNSLATGAVTLSLANQSANTVAAGPATGSATTPTFRALVGADLPLPAASTLGGIESLASVSHKWINTISTLGVPSATQPAFSDISGNPSLAQGPTGVTQMITSPYTNATSGSPTPVTGLSFSAAAGTNYRYICEGNYEGSASTAGPSIDFTGPSAPTSIVYSTQWITGAAGTGVAGTSTAAGYGTAIGGSGAAPTTIFVPFKIVLQLQNGTNSGTVQLQAAPNGAGTLTIQNGMTCHVDIVQ